MSVIKRFLVLVFLFAWSTGLFAQPPVGNTSQEQRLVQINTLYKALDYDNAIAEVDDLRWYLRRERIVPQKEAISMAGLVYQAVNDPKNCGIFLEDMFLLVKNSPNNEQKLLILQEIAATHKNFGLFDKSLVVTEYIAQQMVERQSLDSVQTSKQLQHLADSLKLIYGIAAPSENQMTLEKEKIYLFAGILGAVLLGLILLNIGHSAKLRRKLAQQEQELQMAHTMQSDTPTVSEPISVVSTPSVSTPSAATLAPPRTDTNPNLPSASNKQEISGASFSSFSDNDPLELTKIAVIVEPDSHTSLYIRMLLNSRFQVETARTPQEASDLINQLLPDLVVCNIHLNGVTGTDFVRELKLGDKTAHIPVILLVNDEDSGPIDMARSGADHWLVRPTPSDQLHNQVNDLFDQQKKRHLDFQRTLQLWFSPQRPKSAPAFIATVMTLIEKNIPDPNFTPDLIAQRLQMSNPLFHRKLLNVTGKTPTQLLREMRLEKARYLLETGTVPVPIIAQMVGYSHPGTFTLAYKNYFGDTALLLQE